MLTDRWVVYSTFDAIGAPAPFAEAQLAAYRELGFKSLIVDTSPTLTDERIAAWERSGSAWVRRANVGYDFMSYREGLRLLLDERGVRLDHLDLLFTNDSCYGPFRSLAPVFELFDAGPRDGRRVFGMTDSNEHSAVSILKCNAF